MCVPSLQALACLRVAEHFTSLEECTLVIDAIERAKRRIKTERKEQEIASQKYLFQTKHPDICIKHHEVLRDWLAEPGTMCFQMDGETWKFASDLLYTPSQIKSKRLVLVVINVSFYNGNPRKLMWMYFDSYESKDGYIPSPEFIAFCCDMAKTYFFTCATRVTRVTETLPRFPMPSLEELEAD